LHAVGCVVWLIQLCNVYVSLVSLVSGRVNVSVDVDVSVSVSVDMSVCAIEAWYAHVYYTPVCTHLCAFSHAFSYLTLAPHLGVIHINRQRTNT